MVIASGRYKLQRTMAAQHKEASQLVSSFSIRALLSVQEEPSTQQDNFVFVKNSSEEDTDISDDINSVLDDMSF